MDAEVKLVFRGPTHPSGWTTLAEEHNVQDSYSYFDAKYEIGDEVGLVYIRNADGSISIIGIKKNESDRFLHEFMLMDPQIRYVNPGYEEYQQWVYIPKADAISLAMQKTLSDFYVDKN